MSDEFKKLISARKAMSQAAADPAVQPEEELVRNADLSVEFLLIEDVEKGHKQGELDQISQQRILQIR